MSRIKEEAGPRADGLESELGHWGRITLVISVALMLIGSWWVFRVFQYSAASRQLGTVRRPTFFLPSHGSRCHPTADWDHMLRREQATLHSYGWVDRSRGIVRIPIEREMEMSPSMAFRQQRLGR